MDSLRDASVSVVTWRILRKSFESIKFFGFAIEVKLKNAKMAEVFVEHVKLRSLYKNPYKSGMVRKGKLLRVGDCLEPIIAPDNQTVYLRWPFSKISPVAINFYGSNGEEIHHHLFAARN